MTNIVDRNFVPAAPVLNPSLFTQVSADKSMPVLGSNSASQRAASRVVGSRSEDEQHDAAQPKLLAQAGDWLKTADDFARAWVPNYAITKDFAEALLRDPVGTLAQVSGGLVGGAHTIADMVVGLYKVGETGLAGWLQILNLMGVGAQIAMRQEPHLISQWADDHSTEFAKGLGDMLSYLKQHGGEIPGQVGRALEAELETISALNAKGDPKSKFEAGERFSHLVTSIFAAVESGVKLAQSGVGLSRAMAQATSQTVGGTTRMLRMINTLRNLRADQVKQVAGFVDELARNPAEYARTPTSLKLALREGLSHYASDPSAQRSLRQIDALEGIRRSPDAPATPRLAPGSGSTAGGTGSGSGATAGTQFGGGNSANPIAPAPMTPAPVNPSVQVAANYVQRINNPLVRQTVAAEANRLLQAGRLLDEAAMARLQAQAQTTLAVNTRQAIAGQVFEGPTLQDALRQSLAQQAGADPSKNAALANSPQVVMAQAQKLALDQLADKLFQGSGVPETARAALRSEAQNWAQEAAPNNPAAAIEQLIAQPAWQRTMLHNVLIDQLSGQTQASIAALGTQGGKTAASNAAELAGLRLRLAQSLNNADTSASGLKNLLAQPGSKARSAVVREAVAAQLGGDSPLAANLNRYAVNQGEGERALVDLVTSPQSRVSFMKNALINETQSGPKQKLNPKERQNLRGGLESHLAKQPSDAARMQYLKDLSNSPKALSQMVWPPAAPASSTPATITSPSTRSPVAASPQEPQEPQATPSQTPSAPSASDVQLSGGVFQRGNSLILRSPQLEVPLPPGFTFGPVSALADLGGPNSGYTTISGHGTMMPNALKAAGVPTLVKIPEGTRVVLLTPPGASVGSRLGEMVDNRQFELNYGIDSPQLVPLQVPYRVLGEGQTLPNILVLPKGQLNVPNRPDVITVSAEQQMSALSKLLKPNMGTVVINVCADVAGAPKTRWSGLQFEPDRVATGNATQAIPYGSPPAGSGGISPGARTAIPGTPPATGDGTTPPPLDTSGWKLTTGGAVFGTQPIPSGTIPLPLGTGVGPSSSVPALPVVIADPVTGAPLQVNERGQIESTQPSEISDITAVKQPVSEMNLPAQQALERIGFQRIGPRVSIKVGDYGVVADLWGQRAPDQVFDMRKVLGQLRREGLGEAPTSSADLVERVAQTLARNAPAGFGWSVKAAAPTASAGQGDVGVNLGNYIEVGDLQSALDSGAVLYNPSAPVNSRYRLNTVTDDAGNTAMVIPLQVTVGWRSAVAPTSIPGLSPLPFKLSFSRSSETKTTLNESLNGSLLQTLNAGLNNPAGVQAWHDAGTADFRRVRQINFALPGSPRNASGYSLPPGWNNLQSRMLTAKQRDDITAWSTFTKGVGAVGGDFFGVGGQIGIGTERVERVATNYGPAIVRAYDLPPEAGALARPSDVSSFNFVAGVQGSNGQYRLIEILPEYAPAQRQQGQRVQGDVQGQLVVPGRAPLLMPGSALNAINGHPIAAADVPRIVQFLRRLDPAGTSGQANAQTVYDVVARIQPGQALDAQGIDTIREAIRSFATSTVR